jgi:hypothetical protein
VQGFHNVVLTIDVHVTEHTIRTEVVNSSHMVEMNMADYYGINLGEWEAGGLLSEVWPAVNKHTDTSVSLKKGRLAQTLVAWFCATAYLTLATYSRHAY